MYSPLRPENFVVVLVLFVSCFFFIFFLIFMYHYSYSHSFNGSPFSPPPPFSLPSEKQNKQTNKHLLLSQHSLYPTSPQLSDPIIPGLITPATIFLLILGAITTAYPTIPLYGALLLNALPVAIFVVLCMKTSSKTQVSFAAAFLA